MCEHCATTNTFCGSFDRIDDYVRAVPGWTLDASPLEPGPWRGDSVSLVSSGISFLRFTHASLGRHLAVATYPGITVFVPEQHERSLVLFNQPCATEMLCCHPQGSELELITPRQFTGFSFSASFPLLSALGLEWLAVALGRERLSFSLTMEEAETLRRPLRGVAELLTQADVPETVLSGRVCAVFRGHLLPLLGRLLKRKLAEPKQCRPRRGRKAELVGRLDHRHLTRMLTQVAEQLDAPPSIEALARAQGISTRYVQQLFRRYLGLTPKQYIRSLRLSVVRRDLKLFQARRGVVTEVASAYGFDHLGQFSRDYKNLFGELPNETLARQV